MDVEAASRTKALQYLDRRLKPQLAWYEKRAKNAKDWRHALASVQIIATIAIPVINVFTHSVYVSSFLAGLAALATGFESLYGHREHWLAYRQTARSLEKLLLHYELGLAPFDGADKDERVIAESEATLEHEGSNWAEATRQRSSGGTAPTVVVSG